MTAQTFCDPTRAGLFHLPKSHFSATANAATKAGLKVLEAKLGHCADSEDTLTELGRAWSFPDWYGANFDALYDCLTDPDWQPAPPGYALLISGLKTLQTANPDDFDTLLDVFRSVADARREEGTPFWVLIDLSAPDIPALPDT